jgi:hypothetical protein
MNSVHNIGWVDRENLSVLLGILSLEQLNFIGFSSFRSGGHKFYSYHMVSLSLVAVLLHLIWRMLYLVCVLSQIWFCVICKSRQ